MEAGALTAFADVMAPLVITSSIVTLAMKCSLVGRSMSEGWREDMPFAFLSTTRRSIRCKF